VRSCPKYCSSYSGPKVDIWALGVTFFELLMGRAFEFSQDVTFDSSKGRWGFSAAAVQGQFRKGITGDLQDVLGCMLSSAAVRCDIPTLLSMPWFKEEKLKAEEKARAKAEEEARAKAEEEARLKVEEEARAKADTEAMLSAVGEVHDMDRMVRIFEMMQDNATYNATSPTLSATTGGPDGELSSASDSSSEDSASEDLAKEPQAVSNRVDADPLEKSLAEFEARLQAAETIIRGDTILQEIFGRTEEWKGCGESL